MTRCPFRKAFTQQKSSAKARGIAFLITFDEWKKVWLESGKWEKRGCGANKYCMCRIGDIGAYEVGNVFIEKNKINVHDGNYGKPDSDETKAKKSAALIGKPKEWMRGENNPMQQ